ncbi:hypothetical protein KP509_08G002600 [Ceratopteris richardii]|uniref:Uncharacterized protein n=1 Tax=Ceratopteris richardii TaxID=49495 RepID=A0A8T2U441_CERRI|nr:hypothetical protein KP509_08G002600 [Ceratopteris richardii]
MERQESIPGGERRCSNTTLCIHQAFGSLMHWRNRRCFSVYVHTYFWVYPRFIFYFFHKLRRSRIEMERCLMHWRNRRCFSVYAKQNRDGKISVYNEGNEKALSLPYSLRK